MIKCANCETAAVYTVADPAANSVDYCSTCLPRWLLSEAAAGDFVLRSEGPKKEEEKPKAIKKKAEEETPADESN